MNSSSFECASDLEMIDDFMFGQCSVVGDQVDEMVGDLKDGGRPVTGTEDVGCKWMSQVAA